jgi:3-methyladenine DNA glycosylase AlkD
MSLLAILNFLRSKSDPRNVAGMARFGINPKNTLGVSMPVLRKMARTLRKDGSRGGDPSLDRHILALGLWRSGIHEARVLAALIADPARMDARTTERWVRQVDSWDVCDQLCLNLFDRMKGARARALKWSRRRETFVKRAGFALMAVLAVHDKEAPDASFLPFLKAVERESGDGRNFVKKAVNWALRQVGKRNARLGRRALALARRLKASPVTPARWIGSDASRELNGRWGRD